MFSGSSSYLGGSNSGRPNAPAYGQQPFGQPATSSPFASQQPTGYGGPLQPQYTGYPPQQQLQPQATGYPGQQQLGPQSTGFPTQQQFQSQPTGYQSQPQPQLQPQATGYGGQQPLQSQYTGYPPQSSQQSQQPPQQPAFQQQNPTPAPRQQPQPTGMTSSQIANSFRSSPAAPAPRKTNTSSTKIPSMRLSFITAEDQSKFETLFRSAVGSNQVLSGDQARDLLLRSKLGGDTLSQIWMLSDTTKSGALFFPEFALAMYLCNLSLTGKSLPSSLPDRIKNEVSSMVDIISFSVPDDNQPAPARSNVPSFDEPRQSSFASATVQQPQPQQPSNSQLLSQIVSQPTGYQQPSQFQPQPTGMAPQQTSFLNPQMTGYNDPRPPMPPMPTGFQSNQASMAPLNAQPTGRPGQWGLVNAPVTGLPNLDLLQQQMMPQPGRESGFTSTGLRGNATVPWAVTKDEKKIYDNMFKAWDGFGKGYITGNQAIEIFGQSGLDKPDLERVWTLADTNNKGRLDLDEFAVSMHLIYRKLNGYPIPNRLPPELVPPSTRHLNDSIGSIKSLLSRDAEERKNSGAFLEPQHTGVSYLKNRSFRGGDAPVTSARKDATMYKNNDEDSGYKSSARRRMGAGGRPGSPSSEPTSPVSESSDELSIEQLQKRVREKQVLLDAIDFQDENSADQDAVLDRKDKKDAEELYTRIRRIQEDIDGNPNSSLRTSDSGAEKRTLERQLRTLTDQLPELASSVRRTERAIADAKLELFRLKDAKAHPNGAGALVGTGAGGAVTESDRLKARAKAMMQQRSAALSGRPIAADGDELTAATKRMEEESSKVTSERENNERMVKDVEESVSMFSKGIEDSLKESGDDNTREHEKRRWEDGLGVEDEIKQFIFDLQRSSRAARVRKEDRGSDRISRDLPSSGARTESPAPRVDSASNSGSAPSSSSNSYRSADDRATFIKQQAEQRMAERLAALGLRTPAKAGESVAQRQERERKEKEDRVRQAEDEDAKRERERQRRLADEQIVPPSNASKKPAPPPSRKGRADSLKQAEAEKVKEQQQTQEQELRKLEDEEHRQEQELAREREATETRRKALEEQVRQGKVKKEEEKRRKQAAQRETSDKEKRLAAQRAELEAAREREAELQRQLAALDEDDSSSDEEPAQATPQDSTPMGSQELQRDAAITPPPPAPPAMSPPSAPAEQESKNPFFRRMQAAEPPAALASPPSQQQDTNPFHRLSLQTSATRPEPAALASPAPRTRPKPEEDDWSVVDSSSDDEDDEDAPSGPGAKHLASILFGTMAPPRPMSAMDDNSRSAVASPAPRSEGAPAMPPPPPPMPFGAGAGGPPPAPPPPPPGGMAPPPPPMMPGSFPGAAPPPPPMMPGSGGGGSAPSRAGLLGEIQMGKGLRKVQTKDRSTSSVAGRVL